MNVFVLSTGRCGSETFARACGYMTNYTASHESHNRWLHTFADPPYRSLRYPDRHIEVDNRLAWFLGTLDRIYGDDAFYVHLLRRREEVARSLLNRGERSILYAFALGVLQYYDDVQDLTEQDRYEIGLQYWDTVNDNIERFLNHRSRCLTMWLHEIKPGYEQFWESIGAQGNLNAALAEWDIRHNVSRTTSVQPWTTGLEARPARLSKAMSDIVSVVPSDETILLVDEDQWPVSRVMSGRLCIPFPEKHGYYAGPPADDEAAIAELRRMQSLGARYIVFGWPAFWWLEHYRGLDAHLKSCGKLCLESQDVRVFALGS